ncbi:MAG: SagB/ThcOx family dehydrogenase, partial [Nitrososphaera sp.]
MRFDSGTYYMRAASATGALYPIELYVVCQDIGGLQAGVYHFSPGDFSLTQLRRGDFRPRLAEMAGGNQDILSSPVTLAFTSIAWRNAWKYGDRSYRHWFWDSGVIAANLLAAGASAGLQPALAMGFADSAVNSLLCVEQEKEAATVLAAINSSNKANSEMRPDPMPVPAVS